MHKLEYIHENETQKLLWDFEIQTDDLISAKRLDLVIVYKKKKKKRNEETCRIVGFGVPANQRMKIKESEKRNKLLDLAGELK